MYNLLSAPHTCTVAAPGVSGPRPLHEALTSFMANVGVKILSWHLKQPPPVREGIYMGTYNRSITVLGKGDSESPRSLGDAATENKPVAKEGGGGVHVAKEGPHPLQDDCNLATGSSRRHALDEASSRNAPVTACLVTLTEPHL